MKYNYEIIFGTGNACRIQRVGGRTPNSAAVRRLQTGRISVIGDLTKSERALINDVAKSRKPWAAYASGGWSKMLTAPTSNPKIAKGISSGIATTVLHLSPSVQSGRDVCVFATPGCAAGCLNTAGRGGIAGRSKKLKAFRNLANEMYKPANSIQRARVLKTMFFYEDREVFMTRLADAIEEFVRWARKRRLYPAVRLNGTSDIRWEGQAVTYGGRRYKNLMDLFPGVQFYDYTKNPFRLDAEQRRSFPSNYHLTFSVAELTGKNRLHPEKALKNGMNLAVVFNVKRNRPLPKTWGGLPVVDADLHDMRFLDNIEHDINTPLIAGLRAKGKAIVDESGFVRDTGGREDEFFTGAAVYEPAIQPIFEMRA